MWGTCSEMSLWDSHVDLFEEVFEEFSRDFFNIPPIISPVFFSIGFFQIIFPGFMLRLPHTDRGSKDSVTSHVIEDW